MSENQTATATTEEQAAQLDTQDQQTAVDAGQDSGERGISARDAFETEIVPLLSLLNAKCQQHNISTMTLVGFYNEPAKDSESEQEILCHVTPYQNGMVPAPIGACLRLLDSQVQQNGADAPN